MHAPPPLSAAYAVANAQLLERQGRYDRDDGSRLELHSPSLNDRLNELTSISDDGDDTDLSDAETEVGAPNQREYMRHMQSYFKQKRGHLIQESLSTAFLKQRRTNLDKNFFGQLPALD